MLNINLKRFKFLHKKKQNQIIFSSIETTGEKEILKLFDMPQEKNILNKNKNKL